MTSLFKGLLVPICTYVILAVSLNLTVGILGELSLGHAGFMCVGAFSGAFFTKAMADAIPSVNVRFGIALLVGAAVSALFGFLIGIPVLRLKGDYLAIVTLAFGQIIQNIIMILYVGLDKEGLHFAIKEEANLNLEEGGVAIIKGPMGAVGVAKLASFTAGVVLILLTLLVVQNLVNSRAGRAIMAIRDNRIAAESVGLSITKYKLIAFVTAAALAGAAGALYGLNYSSTVATKFNFNTSILVLVFVVLGGLGSIRGSIIAAALLYVLPELLRGLGLDDYRMLIYAIVLILVMLATNNERFTALMGRVGGWFEAAGKRILGWLKSLGRTQSKGKGGTTNG